MQATENVEGQWGEGWGGGGSTAVTHPDEVVREQPPASAQLSLPPAAIVPPDVHDDVTHRQAQLIVLLSLVVELHHGLHCAQGPERYHNRSNTAEVWLLYYFITLFQSGTDDFHIGTLFTQAHANTATAKSTGFNSSSVQLGFCWVSHFLRIQENKMAGFQKCTNKGCEKPRGGITCSAAAHTVDSAECTFLLPEFHQHNNKDVFCGFSTHKLFTLRFFGSEHKVMFFLILNVCVLEVKKNVLNAFIVTYRCRMCWDW